MRPSSPSLAFLRFVVPAAVLAVAALAFADVPHVWKSGDTLQAADLNASFGALDQRIAALEAQGAIASSYPAVVGRGEHVLGSGNGPTWFCGTAPASLDLASKPLVPGRAVTFSNAFGNVVFTNAGALSLNLDPPTTNPPGALCPTNAMCAEPLTFFLKSPRAQTIRLTSYLDNAGFIYVDGVQQLRDLGGNPNASDVAVPAGSFALSIMACSTDGPTIAFVLYDTFLTNAAYGITIDYDATFHRNGR